MSTRLIALDGGPDISVGDVPVLVGRHPRCDARVDSMLVSRQHCCLVADDDTLIVRDLGSTNGVRINGRWVESGRLMPGDELAIAHLRYRVGRTSSGGEGHDGGDPPCAPRGPGPYTPGWTRATPSPLDHE